MDTETWRSCTTEPFPPLTPSRPACHLHPWGSGSALDVHAYLTWPLSIAASPDPSSKVLNFCSSLVCTCQVFSDCGYYSQPFPIRLYLPCWPCSLLPLPYAEPASLSHSLSVHICFLHLRSSVVFAASIPFHRHGPSASLYIPSGTKDS